MKVFINRAFYVQNQNVVFDMLQMFFLGFKEQDKMKTNACIINFSKKRRKPKKYEMVQKGLKIEFLDQKYPFFSGIFSKRDGGVPPSN